MYDRLSSSVENRAPLDTSKQRSKFQVGIESNYSQKIEIILEIMIPFAPIGMVPGTAFVKLNVKALVTTSDIPIVKPDVSSEDRVLAWVGVATAPGDPSLVRLANQTDTNGTPLYCACDVTTELTAQ